MLIKEIYNKEILTYDAFIEKGINIIDKIYIIIHQYYDIESNTKILIEKFKNKKEIINVKKYFFKENKKINSDLNDDKNIIKIMDKLCKLDIYLYNYIENLKNNIHYIYLHIKELNKNDEELYIYYDKEIKEINKLIFIYKEIKKNNQFDELFEHVINISNIYILVRKIILSINIIIKLGELLKIENQKLRIIHKDLKMDLF